MLSDFPADIIFREYPNLFCDALDEGFQIFTSWSNFLELYNAHMHHVTRPLYVHPATVVDDEEYTNVFVDGSHFIVIPWDELEKYI